MALRRLFTIAALCAITLTTSIPGSNGDKIKVCVIGAGAAGLCAARHLAANRNKFEFTVFEMTPDVGGTWTYTDQVGYDDHGYPIHSSMYRNLKTNQPKEIMSYPDYPNIVGNESCLPHHVILNYLKNYANHFQLRSNIQFNSMVESVKLVEPKNNNTMDKWKVKVKNFETSKMKEEEFDAVIVCNGHYFDPYYPSIPGLKDNFKGEILHSHSYRKPEVFKGKTVILLGAASSGVDIALELGSVASKVYLSHNNKENVTRDEDLGFTEVRGISRFEDGRFILTDNTSVEADVLIFCTGYNYDFPFLDKNTGIQVDSNYISPLYKHMINVDHPSMSFIGVPSGVLPFPLFHIQSQYVVSVLKDRRSRLPSRQQMLEDARLKAKKKRHAHKLDNQWAYGDELARSGRFAALPRYYRIGFETWSEHRKERPGDFKKYRLLVDRRGTAVRIDPPRE